MIVGAGPTGLAAAMDLADFGVPCRLIDKLPGPLSHPRAIGIQARTLELFEQRGIIEPFLRLSHKAHAGNFYSGDKLFLRVDLAPLPSRYHYLTLIDQSQTERIMAEKVRQLGVTVERGVELTNFRDRGNAVELMLKHSGGYTEHTWAPFLIGCDGAHSFIREHLKLGFEGKSYPQTFMLADVHIDWNQSDEEFYVFTSEEGLAAIFPLGGGYHRLVVVLLNEPSDREPSLQECQTIIDRRLQGAPRLSDLRWSSYFHVNSRRVEKLRAGRVFVAGDASHVHSPAAGQGMNTGIQESINLTWKVALVMRREADDVLLDTYEEERQPIEKQVLFGTDLVFGVIGAQNGFRAFFSDHVAPLFDNMELVQDPMRRFVSELAVEYRSSSFSLEQRLEGGLRAGERAAGACVM
jgi:2-polyprenyl-6-methoxyphenol hydroxylase-like FAD-dependent oxidoreductase